MNSLSIMNSGLVNGKEFNKRQEYVKQQQQLRALGNIHPTTNFKSLSAESMIEDLLSKKETFQKRIPEAQQIQETPGWLVGAVHPMYERVWLGVESAGGLADTPLFSSLLISSGLSTDTLGYIWSVANRTVSGALTQTEVYLVLALVGLAQTGYVVNNLATVYQLPHPPVPTLDLTLLPTRVPGSHTHQNPLNVSSLPDPLNFNWVSTDRSSQSSSESIDISYVGSGSMVNPKSITEVVSNTTSLNLSDFRTKNNSRHQQKTISDNMTKGLGFDSKTNPHMKHSSNVYSFSFPSLNESPSHVPGLRTEESNSLDDEFTEFQSADFTSALTAEYIKNNTKSVIDDEEFTNFQKASPNLVSDDLSVLVVGGKSIPSAQQLWVTDSPSSNLDKNKFKRVETERKEINSNVRVTDIPDSIDGSVTSYAEKNLSQNKYEAFQQVDDDKYSVFHNPLSDDEDKQSEISDKMVGKVHKETKSIFNHSLLEEPESSVDVLEIHNSSVEIPTFQTDFHNIGGTLKKDDGDEEDDEFSNFQNFPVSFSGTHTISENLDKYDVFRTIVFQDTTFEPPTLHLAKTIEPREEMVSHMQSSEVEMGVLNNVNQNQEFNSFENITKKENINDITFGAFPGSLTETSNIDHMFSSLAISEKNIDEIKFGNFKESSSITSTSSNPSRDNLFSSVAVSNRNCEKPAKLISDPAEDKYKALRLLETETFEADDFGEFLGVKLTSSINEPNKNARDSSIQIRCLEACLNLLKAGLDILSRALSPMVISEVIGDPRANNYLECLLEIHRVSERILLHIDGDSTGTITAELNQVWESLAPFFTHMEHNHMAETIGAVCGVCQSNIGPSPVTFGALSFHTPCANLYLHCVEPVLPNIASSVAVQ